jgi:hypothetical protein
MQPQQQQRREVQMLQHVLAAAQGPRQPRRHPHPRRPARSSSSEQPALGPLQQLPLLLVVMELMLLQRTLGSTSA